MSLPAARAYGLALGLLALGGLGLLVAYGMTWAVVEVSLLPGSEAAMTQGPMTAQELTGRALHPLAGASGWVALASVAGILATRSWGRLVVAAIGLAAGATGLIGAVAAVVSPPDGRTGGAWLLAALAGAAVCAGATWSLARGRTWPVMGRRYERQPAARRMSAWDAQDLGRDPTDDLVE